MAGGPIFPNSVYVGGASGNLSATVYVPATNTNSSGAIEGIGVISTLGSGGVDASAVLQFQLPTAIPPGTLKLRTLGWANATSGSAKITPSDGQTAVGSNIGATTLTAETQITLTWTAADVIVENKTILDTVPTASNILTVQVTFNNTGWTLAAVSVWVFSLVWE